ncbi:MAG: CPBP family intramembrane glutamic endopeptidase [Patescibacteria group bacterium]
MRSTAQSTKRQYVILCLVAAWFVFWIASNAYPWVSSSMNILQGADVDVRFGALTLWILIISAVTFFVWGHFLKKKDFFAIRPAWSLFFLVFPVYGLLYYAFRNTSLNNVNGLLYGCGVIISVVLQQIVTFGLLQSSLEKVLTLKNAAIVTGCAFFIGHLIYGISFLTIIFAVAAIVFSWLRYRYRSILPGSIIHLIFSLLPF